MRAAVITSLKQLNSVQADLYELRLDDIFKDVKSPVILTYKNLPVSYIDGKEGNLVSYHNYEATPDLEIIYRELQKTPAKLYKIAVFANSSLDTLKILQLQKREGSKLVALAMGELGQPSRILGPKFGAPITYAATDRQYRNAPGQLTLKELENYKVDSQTAIYGLIGDPVSQSISHITHNRYFQLRKMNAVYLKFRVTQTELPFFLQMAKELGFSGLSVTAPLKEAIIPLLDALDPLAEQIGAVNTLQFKEGKVIGYNTDILGMRAIVRHLELEGKRVQIYGAGGAARALIFGCLQAGAEVSVHNRSISRANQVAEQFGCRVGLHKNTDLAINCTTQDFACSAPMGMDINLKPRERLFLQNKRKIYGYEMFAEQALGQFKIWT